MTRRAVLPVLAAFVLVLSALGVASPAAAAVKTTTTFATTELTAPFGSPWQLAVSVTIANDFGTAPVQPSDGSIDILLDGMPGEYATAAAIAPGGVAYFVQPANEPPLAAGTYSVTARFTPAAGSGLSESTTKKVAKLTIEALTVVPTVEVISDPALTSVPTVRTSLAGTFVDTTGAPPSGSWSVTAVDSAGETSFEGTAAQPTQGADGSPVGVLDIPIDTPLKASETYTVTTVFTPDELIAGGLTVEQATTSNFTTRAATIGEILGAPTGVPIVISVLLGLLVAGLAGLLVWLIVQWRRFGSPEPEPALVEVPAAIAAPVRPETRALPPVLTPEDPYLPPLPSHPLAPPPPPAEPTSWSLSDLGLDDPTPEDPDEPERR